MNISIPHQGLGSRVWGISLPMKMPLARIRISGTYGCCRIMGLGNVVWRYRDSLGAGYSARFSAGFCDTLQDLCWLREWALGHSRDTRTLATSRRPRRGELLSHVEFVSDNRRTHQPAKLISEDAGWRFDSCHLCHPGPTPPRPTLSNSLRAIGEMAGHGDLSDLTCCLRRGLRLDPSGVNQRPLLVDHECALGLLGTNLGKRLHTHLS